MEAVEHTIPGRFEQQAATYPNRIAVKTRTRAVTYAQLNHAANDVASAVMAQCGAVEQPVALLFEHGAPFIIASLGLLKAGRIQVPLESTFPSARLRYMLERSRASVLVTNEANLARARGLGARTLINVDEIDHRPDAPNPNLDLSPHQVVAIGFTSGSTGDPKGIVWNQRGILHAVMRHTNTYHVSMDDRIVAFRATLRPYLYTLLNGATYYPVVFQEEGPAGLADWMAREAMTVYRAAVTGFRTFAAALRGTERFPHLRLILLFGEAVYRADVDLYRRHFAGSCLLASSLGCKEFDDYACCFIDKETPLAGGRPPAADLMPGTEILLLGENGRPVDAGRVGEIVIRSPYNAIGYWRQADLTRAAFRPDAADRAISLYRTGDLGRMGRDGRLTHAGRKDFQVKIRGHRVEVAEVEAALLEVGGVQSAAVVAHEAVPGDRCLIAYIVAAGPPPRLTDMRQRLGAALPEYMVPSSFVFLDAMPLTVTGKVDRRALPLPGRTRPSLGTPFVAPATSVEERLAAMWAGVLALDAGTIGRHDDFWTLGGNSLLATRVLSRVLAEFCVELPLRALFAAPTVSELADEIARSQARTLGPQEARGTPDPRRPGTAEGAPPGPGGAAW